MSNRSSLTPASLKMFTDRAPIGSVWVNEDDHIVAKTYFYAGQEYNGTGPPLYRFISWQGTLVYRTQLTMGETERLRLTEVRRGLSPSQLSNVASMLYRHWESDERRSVEIHNLRKVKA